MIKYFKNRFGGSINLADKTHPKPQRRPEKAKNQLDVCLDKEKIMKSNQAKPRNPRRIPARPGVAAISASSPSSPTTPGGENHQAPQADLRCLETSSPLCGFTRTPDSNQGDRGIFLRAWAAIFCSFEGRLF